MLSRLFAGWFKQHRDASGPGAGSYLVDGYKSDTVDLPKGTLSLYVEVGGAVHFTGLDGAEDTWNVPDNTEIPVAMSRVWATGTNASGMHGVT